MDVRPAVRADLDDLARIWYEGWHDAHARIVPSELTRLRTLTSFRDRLEAALADVLVVDSAGEPVGFCVIKDAELYQLFVSVHARGSGVAATLLADAEARLREAGIDNAWLACAIGNERAARFYEKWGWRRTGVVVYHPETSAGIFRLEVWRYEKRLSVGV